MEVDGTKMEEGGGSIESEMVPEVGLEVVTPNTANKVVEDRYVRSPLARANGKMCLVCRGTSADGTLCNKIAIKDTFYCLSHQKQGLNVHVDVTAQEFLFEHVRTLDPHDPINPIKKFPRSDWAEKALEVWLQDSLILVVKSRQMMASWLYVALHLWDAMYHSGRSVFFVSKKEEDAGYGNQLSLLSRARFIIEHLPSKLLPPGKDAITYDKRPPSISFPKRYSTIMAVSQDAEALRQYTASRILSDEMAFQERAEKAYVAMKPTIDGGGALTGISTPNGRQNLFYYLVNDIQKGSKRDQQNRLGTITSVRQEALCKGLTLRKNRNGFTVLSLHYSADSHKNDDWVRKHKKSALSLDSWNQEMELDFTKTEGTRVYPAFEQSKHVRKLNYNPHQEVWRCWDFGYNHPACVWAQLGTDDKLYVLREYLGEEILIQTFAQEVKGLSQKWFPGAKFKDACDPAGRAVSDKSERTSVDILRGMDIRPHMRKGSVKDGINCIRALLVDKGNGVDFLIDPCCEVLVDGFMGGYIRDDVDEPIKDGFYEHLMDALRYMVMVAFDVRTFRPIRCEGIYVPDFGVLDRLTGM